VTITIKYQDVPLGHEICGVDIARGVSDADFAQIEKAFNDAGVVVIRDQQLTPEQQLAFSRRFGELENYPLGKFILPGHDEILVVSNILEDGKPIGLVDAGRAWHSDMSFVEKPPRASLLYSLEVPRQNGKVIGDTLFASTAAAWDGLPDETRRKIDGLKVRNSFSSYAVNKTDGREKEGDAVPDVMHPLVRTHPLTGRKCLFFSERVTASVGDLDRAATAALIAQLLAHLTQPKYVYRHNWREGDLIIWDNCSSMHKAIFDYALPLRRRMHRTTVKGTRPY
jgi:taurine dioxygenase